MTSGLGHAMTNNSAIWTEILGCALAMAAATMYGVWLIERRSTYLVLIGIAPISLALGMMANLLPIAIGWRIAINALFFAITLLVAIEGFTRRADRTVGRASTLIPAAAGMVGIFLVAVTHRDLAWEVRLQDVTVAYLAGCGIWHARLLTNRRFGDRVLGLLMLGGIGYFVTRSWFGLDRQALYTGEHSSFDVFTPPFVMVFVAIIVANVALLTVQEVHTVIEALRRERDTDVLTGALNRRGLQTRVEQLLDSPKHVPSSFVVFDLDKFKSINDLHGHATGDAVLRTFGGLLRASVRENDLVGRLGGDEFAVYLNGLTYPYAVTVAERVRTTLSRAQIQNAPAAKLITASFGIAPTTRHMAFADLVSAADNRLYEAKRRETAREHGESHR
ncbi:diguanylate cyclase [Mycolicibacterium sp. CBMA 234]|uniref:GGDEF domain-containing protein n=1 Tax=Mycolicibacterium sp. CBMA 234 TaxID=1918495 RepID=UPI001391E3DD|nr:GGDEF domain-containing protein [Mycolicibacterium sp. CBMA 234]